MDRAIEHEATFAQPGDRTPDDHPLDFRRAIKMTKIVDRMTVVSLAAPLSNLCETWDA